MFVVGERYKFSMWEPGEDGGKITHYPGCEVLEVNLPLVMVKDRAGDEIIVNAASQAFVSATKATP
jgi:hypothetical protein